MTREEFEEKYAKRSNTTVEFLHSRGQRAEPCDCVTPGCEGWAMVSTYPLLEGLFPTSEITPQVRKAVLDAVANALDQPGVKVDMAQHQPIKPVHVGSKTVGFTPNGDRTLMLHIHWSPAQKQVKIT